MGGWTFCNHLFILSLLHHFQHMITITSTHNEKIKDVQKLFRSRGRKENKLFIIEGYREISRALKKGYHFKSLFFCPDLEGFKYQGFVDSSPSDELFAVSTQVFSRIAYRENQDGLLALAYMKNHTLEELKVIKNGLYLVIETVEKPGNLGAILRTADGAGIDAVFICDNQTDIYNPNVVRSSLGCLFSTTVIAAGSRETIEFLKKNNIAIYSAALQNSKDYYECDFRKGSAFVMGSEAKGLSHQWRSESDHLIKIPMHGIADSLNVSVSAAILIYEALRQRSKPKTKKIVNKS